MCEESLKFCQIHAPLVREAVSSLELAQEDFSGMLVNTVDGAGSWPIKACEY